MTNIVFGNGGGIILKQELIKTELNVINNKIGIMRVGNVDYISITDLALIKIEQIILFKTG